MQVESTEVEAKQQKNENEGSEQKTIEDVTDSNQASQVETEASETDSNTENGQTLE